MIPIIDGNGRIVGWTRTAPNQRGGRVIHREAATMIGSALGAAFVDLDARDAQRAGAPDGWTGPWRCLAICPARMAQALAAEAT